MNALILGLQSDPFITTVIVGIIWPLVQAALDKPWWTRGRRVGLLAIVALVVTAAVWVSGSYPATWQMLTSQLSVFLGTAWAVYQILVSVKINGASILDWVGAVTPGGQALDELTGKSGTSGD
nr:MAG TPA: hypothetical protein [Caudoviricetes sp.]